MTYNEYYDNEPDYVTDCKSAVRWAKTTLDQPFLIFDTETTGLDSNAEAVQIAIINQNGDRIFESLVKPVGKISPQAIAIHGIDDKKLKYAPTFNDIYLKIKAILESSKILIYNSAFDVRIINQQCYLNDLPSINIKSECVMNWYAQYCGDWSDYHQSYTWQRLPGADHSAIGDCRATLAVIKEMAYGR